MADIRSEAAHAYHHILFPESTQGARQLKQLQCLLQGDGLDRLCLLQRGKLRLFLIVGRADLSHGTVTPNFHRYLFTTLGVSAQYPFSCLAFRAHLYRLLHDGVKQFVEGSNRFVPLHLAFGNLVELLLHLRGEVVVDHRWKILHQEVVHHHPDVGGQQLVLVGTGDLLFHRVLNRSLFEGEHIVTSFLPLHTPFIHILAVHDGGDGGGIGRGTTDAQLLHLAYKSSLGVAWRSLCETLRGGGLRHLQPVTLLYRWQDALLLFIVLVVGTFKVNSQEPIEPDHLTVGGETTLRMGDADVDRGALQLGIGHL